MAFHIPFGWFFCMALDSPSVMAIATFIGDPPKSTVPLSVVCETWLYSIGTVATVSDGCYSLHTIRIFPVM